MSDRPVQRGRCDIATQVTERSEAERIEAARQFAIAAARLAANTRCHEVVVLDVSRLSPVTDFFVIASGTSPRQMRTAADDVEEMASQYGYSAFSRAGYEGESWILTDYIDVIVHVFGDQARRFYDLDNLWGDAQRLEWRQPQGAAGK